MEPDLLGSDRIRRGNRRPLRRSAGCHRIADDRVCLHGVRIVRDHRLHGCIFRIPQGGAMALAVVAPHPRPILDQVFDEDDVPGQPAQPRRPDQSVAGGTRVRQPPHGCPDTTSWSSSGWSTGRSRSSSSPCSQPWTGSTAPHSRPHATSGPARLRPSGA